VWLPGEAVWLAELALFPAGRHDDQVHSATPTLATHIHLPPFGEPASGDRGN
jgi:phage terminase large subunit-like protein